MHSESRQGTLALAAVCLTSLMFGLEISSIPAILPTLETVLHADFKQLQWVMNAYTIAVTTVLMAAGTLADRYGRKRVYLIAIVAFALSSLICGLARDPSLLIIARFLQGMSGGAMLICQVSVLSHQFQAGRARAIAFGWWGIIFGIGLGFGPIIGGAIVALLSWEWVFLVHVPLGVVALFLAASGVQESCDPGASSLDLAGIVTLSLAVFCLAFFITQGPDLGFNSWVAVVVIAVFIASFVGFIIAERLSPRPMFDFSVFRIRDFSGALIGSMAMNFSFWPFMIYLPIYFQAGLGYDSVGAGLALLAYTLPTLVVPPLAERAALRYHAGLIIPLGLFAIGLGFMLMKLGSSVDNASWLTMLPGCIFAGVGLGMTNTPVTNTTTGAVTAERAGMASGIDMSARMISLAINIALMGLILVEGVRASLKAALPATADAGVLRSIAESVAAGTAIAPDRNVCCAVVHQALTDGFGWVLLYGGVSVWVLAAVSFVIFGARLSPRAVNRTSPQCSAQP